MALNARQRHKLKRLLRLSGRDSAQITDPLTPRRLKKELSAAEKLKFGPADRELADQRSSSNVQQGRITDWYGQYQAAKDAAIERQQAAQREANAAIVGMQTSAQTQDDAARQQAQTTAQADAAARGTTAGTEPLKADLDAAAARRASTSSFGSMLATQGAARDAYMIDKGRIAAGDETQQHLDEAGRARGIDKAERELADDKGAFRVQYKADARESERKNDQVNAAFGLDQAKAQVDASLKAAAQRALDHDRKTDNRRQRKQDKRSNMENDRRFNLDVTKFGRDAAKDNYQRKHKLGPYKPAAEPKENENGLTPAQIRARREKSNKALTEVQTIAAKLGDIGKSTITDDDKGTKDTSDDVTRPPSRDEVLSRARSEGADEDQLIVALALRHKDKVWDARTRAAAKRLGIRVPKQHKPHPNEAPNLGDQRGENAKG